MNTQSESNKNEEPTKGSSQSSNSNCEPSVSQDEQSKQDNKDFKSETRYRRDFSKPSDTTGGETESKKLSIEEEFDKFFSKYRNPVVDRYKSPSNERNVSLGLSKKFSSDLNGVAKKCEDSASDQEAKLKSKPPRKSRFLRPDFYDTPPEESKYVIKNEKVRAFRERSLSRQRELARNRSTDSVGSNGSTLNDYVRSKTCSLTDKLEDSRKRESYRRTISEDCGKFELSRSSSRNELETGPAVSSAISHRKSMILQNELENEIRKTKNMNSKLSGLMLALNDNENQYERKLERLYGLKTKSDLNENKVETTDANGSKDESIQANGVADASANESDKKAEKKPVYDSEYEKKLNRLYGLKTKCDYSERKPSLDLTSRTSFKEKYASANGSMEKKENEPSKLSLLEKKFAYFRKLQHSGDDKEKTDKEDDKDPASESGIGTADNSDLKISISGTSTASFDNDTSSLTTPTEEVDSDAWSVLSDGADSQLQDSMNDRIRRRSFYSRFNIYKQKSTPNTQKSRPLAYSRSLSADYRHRSVSSSRPVQ